MVKFLIKNMTFGKEIFDEGSDPHSATFYILAFNTK